MNKNITKLSLVIAGGVLFNLLFWQEKMGVNTVLYDLWILTALFYLFPQALRSGTVRLLTLGHLLCLAMVVYHNSTLSKFACITTIALLAPFAEYAHHSAWFAGGSMIMNMVLMLASFAENLIGIGSRSTKRRSISRFVRFGIIPFLILLIFFWIYSAANDAFSAIACKVLSQIGEFLGNFLEIFSPTRILFFLLGLFITGAIILKSRVNWFSQKDNGYTDNMQRIRRPFKKRRRPSLLVQAIMGRFSKGVLALKNENTTGIISLALLNLLLLVVNIVDIQYLWFNFKYDESEPVYKMVHEGTELLIASIVLAMVIVLFFFKGNLNFYKRNKWLKYGAYAWVLQNLVLVISVAIRDYYYIARHGLAYKRIGVLFFLAMVLIGLVTVFVKITTRKTSYYLWRVNAWAGIVILIVSTTIHWDELIARYNLQRKDVVALDVPFLLSLSDKTLPLLDQNKSFLQKMEEEAGKRVVDNGRCRFCYTEQLEKRKKEFFMNQEKKTWLSWNYADDYVKRYFEGSAASVKTKQ